MDDISLFGDKSDNEEAASLLSVLRRAKEGGDLKVTVSVYHKGCTAHMDFEQWGLTSMMSAALEWLSVEVGKVARE